MKKHILIFILLLFSKIGVSQMPGRFYFEKKDSAKIIELYADFEFAIIKENCCDSLKIQKRGHYKIQSDSLFLCNDYQCKKIISKYKIGKNRIFSNNEQFNLLTFSKKELRGRYIGYWADTEWIYEFYPEFQTYVLKISGHFDYSIHSQKYEFKNDTIFVNKKPLFLYDDLNDCIIEIGVKFDYCKVNQLSDVKYYMLNINNPVYTNFSFEYKEIKFPYTITKDSDLITKSKTIIHKVFNKSKILQLLKENNYQIITELPGLNGNFKDQIILDSNKIIFYKGYIEWTFEPKSSLCLKEFRIKNNFGYIKFWVKKSKKYTKITYLVFRFGKKWICI